VQQKKDKKMKKIMILCSAIILACSANAASMVWGFGGYDYVSSSGEGFDEGMGMNLWSQGKAYIYLGTVTATDSKFSFGDAILLDSALYDQNTWQYGVGTPTENAKLTSTEAGQAFTLILVDAVNKNLESYEGNYVLVTGVSKETPIPGAGETTYYSEFYYNDPVTKEMWSSMKAKEDVGGDNVPEPTSGLLMLIGAAGLALRRKNA
jgi:hypothetical protein